MKHYKIIDNYACITRSYQLKWNLSVSGLVPSFGPSDITKSCPSFFKPFSTLIYLEMFLFVCRRQKELDKHNMKQFADERQRVRLF